MSDSRPSNRTLTPLRVLLAGALLAVAIALAYYQFRARYNPAAVHVDRDTAINVDRFYSFARETPHTTTPIHLLGATEARETIAEPGTVLNSAAIVNQDATAPSPYVSAPLRIPPGAGLSLETAARRPADARSVNPVEFRVDVETADGARHRIHEVRHLARPNGEPMAWAQASVPLDAYANQVIRVVFSNGSPGDLGGPREARALWGNPVIHVPASRRTDDPPNILLISLDTLRADRLQCYGFQRETSPYLVEFARNAHLFENCFSPSSWTLPAHASLMTGLAPAAHGAISFEGGNLPAQRSTLAELAAQNGYRTAAFTSGGYVDSVFGFARGFERYSKYPAVHVGNSIGDTLAWIDAVDGSPFFVFWHTYLLHEPYQPDNAYKEKFADPDYAGPVGGYFDLEDRQLAESLTEEDRAHVENLYLADLRRLDDLMKFFLSRLRSIGHWEDTLIVIFSDHGEEFWDHGQPDHGVTLYDEQLHVPLIIKLPGPAHGSRISDLVDLTDVFATALRWMNAGLPPQIQSHDLTPLMHGEAGYPGRPYILSQVGYRPDAWGEIPFEPVRRSIRTLDQKLILNPYENPIEFYDLSNDPGETVNRAGGNPASQALKDLLDRHLAEQANDKSLWTEGPDEGTFGSLESELEALGYL